jgi:hypothetical protein
MSIQLHQWGGSSECGVVSLFPQRNARHSGYNAGTGWWGRYFGAGRDGSIGKRGGIPANNANRWNTVRINARADGWVDFYLNGSRRYRIRDNRYKSGVVRVGYGCRRFRFRNLRVKCRGCSKGSRKTVKSSGVRRLALQSGWRAYGSGYEAPSTTKYGHVCVVSGLIKRNGMRNPLATLPGDCRPNKRVIFSLNNHQYQLRVDVLPNGQIHYVTGTWRHGWLNLDGINFATRNQRDLPVQNGWRGYGGSYKVPTYTKTGVVCEVEGLVRGGH